MRKTVIAWAAGIALLGDAVQQEPNVANAADQWSPNTQVTALQLSRSGQALGVRFQNSEEFVPVENRLIGGAVKNLAFRSINLGFTVYYGENEEGELVLGTHYRYCRSVFKPIEEIFGDVYVYFYPEDGAWETVYPDGQRVRIYDEGNSIDFGSGPTLDNFDFRIEHTRDVTLKGVKSFVLHEFINATTGEVVSRSIVGEDFPD